MEEISLPQTLSDLKAKFNVDSDTELVNLLTDPSNLSPVQKQIWKYSGAALEAGRPLDSTIICVAGATGAGKSTTINSFYGDNTLCNTNAWESETSDIVFIRKSLKVTKENPIVLTHLNFVDMPGYFDTNSPEEEARHHAKLRQFKESRIELAKRTDIPLPFRFMYGIPKTVCPNLVLFVIKATDNRIGGGNSQLMKSLKLLKENGDLVDTKMPNLIVVVTHVMQLGRKKNIEKFEAIKEIVSNAVWNTFGLTQVDIVPIENDPEDSDLLKKGDFYELPIKDDQGNNQLSHYNLYQAMKERLSKNKDLLGRLCMAWYCHTECPDRKIPAEIIDIDIPGDWVEVAQDVMEMSPQHFAVSGADEPKMCKFQSLGYGFCPVTEKVMPSSPLEQCSEPTVVEIAKSKFLIPAGVSVFDQKVSKSHFLTFFRKEEYEGHMHNSYGIEAGVRLVVNASFKGKWVAEAKGSQQQSWISQVHEIQVATLKLNDPRGHLKHEKFQKTLDSLPDHYSEETAPEFRSFFSRWGSHLIYEQGIGGAIQLNCAVKEQKITREKLTEIQNEIKGVFQVLFTTGNANADQEFKTDAKALRSIGVDNEQLEISGGDPPLLPTLNTFTPQELKKWSESVSSEPAELKRTMKLFPYYNLIDGDKSEALRKATEDYLTNSLLGKVENEFKRNAIADDDLEDVMDEPVKESSCFPRGTTVFVDGGTHTVPIEYLGRSYSPSQVTTLTLHGVSDKMKIGKFSDTKFCTFLDAKPEVEIDYISLNFTNGKKLLVSEGHMIFQYIPDKQVVIGKQAKYFKIGELAVYTDSTGISSLQYPVVTQITKEKHVGAYSPLTMSGTFLAEGFLVSSYASVNSFKLAQCALAPLKMWHFTPKKSSKAKRFGDDAVKKSDSGIHPYAKFLIAFRKSFTGHWQEIRNKM